ncbi:MAG: hypothetical protein HC861_01545 [Rhodospirillaceae bacterium]|nr:hypothetical protein [Rhodospirillaceae bacterium]
MQRLINAGIEAYEETLNEITSRGYHYIVAGRPAERTPYLDEFEEEGGWEEVVREVTQIAGSNNRVYPVGDTTGDGLGDFLARTDHVLPTSDGDVGSGFALYEGGARRETPRHCREACGHGPGNSSSRPTEAVASIRARL